MAARALLALALPRTAAACAVCFGKAAGQEGLFRGLTLGLFVLIGSTMAMLAGIAAAMIRIERRRAAAERASS